MNKAQTNTKLPDSPFTLYKQLMIRVRERFDAIDQLNSFIIDKLLMCETTAFLCRKVIEAISYASLICIHNGTGSLPPRKVRMQWSANYIFDYLSKNGYKEAFPSPSDLRKPYPGEEVYGCSYVVAGIPEHRLTIGELNEIYNFMHSWSHEFNPYNTKLNKVDFLRNNEEQLWKDKNRLWNFIYRHCISLNGNMYFCTLKDKNDGKVKLLGLTKSADIPDD